MRRHISVTWPADIPALSALPDLPDDLHLSIPPRFGETPEWHVELGTLVERGQLIASSRHVEHHAPLGGQVVGLSEHALQLSVDPLPRQMDRIPMGEKESYAAFLRRIGLVGMGGSMFPAARKATRAQSIHTLVINGVECEPGITIDQSLLLHASAVVRAGVNVALEKTGAQRVILAISRHRKRIGQLKDLYPFELLRMPAVYPAGAERLIMRKLTGKMPVQGELPIDSGILVQNVASIWAVGKAATDGQAVLERPLSIACPSAKIFVNWVAPIGTPVKHLLRSAGVPYNSEKDVLVAGGLMMGRKVTPEFGIEKGTTSVVVVPRAASKPPVRDCIRCGACNAICPLQLHPIGMVDRAGEPDIVRSVALSEQLSACFLCGACEAVCPSGIRLVQHLKEAKSWIPKPVK